MYGRRNLFNNMENAFRTFNRIGNELSKGITIETGSFNPKVDILENDDAILVYMEIAGVKKEDVSLSVNDSNILTIRGTRDTRVSDENRVLLRNEIAFGEFVRSFQMPDEIDSEAIKANFNNGLLVINIPKKQAEEPKEFNININ